MVKAYSLVYHKLLTRLKVKIKMDSFLPTIRFITLIMLTVVAFLLVTILLAANLFLVLMVIRKCISAVSQSNCQTVDETEMLEIHEARTSSTNIPENTSSV